MITLKTENISCVPEGSLCFFPGNSPTGNHWLSCYHHWLVLPLLQLHEVNPKWTLSCVLFCVLFLPFNIMSLRFIHVVAGNNLVCFIEELIFHHYEYARPYLSILLLGVWVVSSLEAPWIKLVWIFLSTSFGGALHSFLLHIYFGVGMLGHRAGIGLVFVNTAR